MRCVPFFILMAIGQAVNPIQKVLSMLQNMSAKVTSIGDKEQAEYEEYSQWCRDQSKDLQFAIKTANGKIEEEKATISKAKSDVENADSKIQSLSDSISSAEKTGSDGNKVRADAHASFLKEEKELQSTISALQSAHGILEKEINKHSFAQLPNTIDTILTSLESILSASSVNLGDKDKLNAFLQAKAEAEESGAPVAKAYESHSSGILDVVDDMLDKAEEQLSSVRKREMEEKFNHDLLIQSVTDQVKSQNKEMEETKKEKAQAQETLAVASGSLQETNKSHGISTKALADLHHECMKRASEFEEEVKERAAELKALGEAHKIVVEATGGASKREYAEVQASFLQVAVRSLTPDEVSRPLRKAGLAMLASRVQSLLSMGGPFDKVKKMIEGMITKLQDEHKKEASHKAFCDEEMSKATTKKEDQSTRVGDLTTRSDKTKAALAKLKEEVAAAQNELSAIAKSQAEMDKMRAEAKALFTEASADYQQGVDGLEAALKVLRDYYASKEEATSFVQMKDASNGIIDMLEVAQADFAKSLADIRSAEAEQQEEYDTTTQENKERTASLSAEVKAKTAAIKSTDNVLAEVSDDTDNAQSELDAVLEGLEKLKSQCVARPEPYEERKRRREAEMAGLKEALEILENESGSSFLSVRRHQY